LYDTEIILVKLYQHAHIDVYICLTRQWAKQPTNLHRKTKKTEKTTFKEHYSFDNKNATKRVFAVYSSCIRLQDWS